MRAAAIVKTGRISETVRWRFDAIGFEKKTDKSILDVQSVQKRDRPCD